MVEYGLLARGEDHRLAGEAAAIRKLLSGEWQLGEDAAPGSQPAPSATADNDRADKAGTATGTTDGGANASPEQPAEDFIQSTAGSSESKKDQ